MITSRLLASVACLFISNWSHAAVLSDGANWPQFRGPNAAGVSANANLPD